MTDVVMADFQKIASSFSSEDTVSAISFLVEKLKNTVVSSKEPPQSGADSLLQTLFEHADSLQLSSKGQKWTREELYER